jgi:hypothetical protein
MTDNYKYGIEDLISTAASQKPIEFEQAFNDLIVDRLQAAINDKKIQVAQQMYGYNADEPELETESE